LWFDEEATAAAIIELRTTDHRIGLLYRVAAALESSAVTVRWARIGTLGSSVVDSFCLTGSGEQGGLAPEVRELVERAVRSAAR
jgi:[protein-PII] uridylyltransferase